MRKPTFKTFALALGIGASSCAGSLTCADDFAVAGLRVCTQYDYTTPEETLDRANIEDTVRIVSEELARFFPGAPNFATALDSAGVVVVVSGEPLFLGCDGTSMSGITTCNQIGGAYLDGQIILDKSWHDTCLSRAVLVHELLHVAQALILKVPLDHETPALFTSGGSITAEHNGIYENVEYQAKRRLKALYPVPETEE
jgi:hypothetical protein